jgi:hypothetical protein
MSVSEKLQWADSMARILKIINNIQSDPHYKKEHIVDDLLEYVDFLEDSEPVMQKQ